MPVDTMGAVTIYYVAPLNSGLFLCIVIIKAPASHARLPHAIESARVHGVVVKSAEQFCCTPF